MQAGEIPAGAVPIDVREFFECIGELYFQVHKLRQVVTQQQAQPAPQNGTAADLARRD